MKERYNQGKNVKGLEHNPYVIGQKDYYNC